MIKKLSRNVMRQKRHIRMRQTITGTESRPRLSVYRSNKGYYVQLVDDLNQLTLLAVRSQDLGLTSNSKETAKKLGKPLLKKQKQKGLLQLFLTVVDIYIMDVFKC